MKFGLQFCYLTWPGGPAALAPTVREVAVMADEGGLDGLWALDHFFQMEFVGRAEEPMLEGYTLLTYLAALTRNVRLGTLVTGVIYRNPALLLKQVTGLDVLSGGRAWLGIGAAWYEREARGYGFPFPPLGERFEWLEEALQMALVYWKGEGGAYHGKHFHAEELLCSPPPITEPHPPILVGGMGEKKTLKLVARYADACNFAIGDDLGVLDHKLNVLKRHCEKVGRDYNTIERTVVETFHLAPDKMSADDVVRRIEALRDHGAQHIIFNMPNLHEQKPLETFLADILPKVR